VSLGVGLALSPDGRTLVYSGTGHDGIHLYKRTLDALESVPIRGAEGGRLPFFSPDGVWVGFSAGRALKKVPLKGGVATTVSEAAGGQGAATWLSDDTIVFATEGRGLMRIPASGGEPRQVTVLDRERGELEHRWPIVLPGDRTVLFTVHYGGQDSQRVHVVSLQSGQRAALVQGNGARFLPAGRIAFQRSGSIWVAPFDETRLELTGPPTAVLEGIGIGPDWSPIVGVGRDGSLAYAAGAAEPYPPRTLVWVDRTGHEEPVDAPARAWFWPQISPDGRRLGFHIMDPVNMDAWIYELDHGPLVRMTYHATQDGFPLWTPDGKLVAFWSRQAGDVANLYLRSADLTGTEKRLTTSGNTQAPVCWAREGKLLVFQEDSPKTKADIGVVPIEGVPTPQMIIRGPADEQNPAMSPDGRWIAYQSNFSGRWEVYVQPFPGLDGRWQVSTQGGLTPTWHPNGRELFYRSARAMMGVPVETTGTSFKHSNPKVLFEGSYVADGTTVVDGRNYVLRPDGERFLMMKEERRSEPRIVVISNWIEELKRLVPTR
jgi:serine/threonine-protein kinase